MTAKLSQMLPIRLVLASSIPLKGKEASAVAIVDETDQTLIESILHE
jgi:hypothetical protein